MINYLGKEEEKKLANALYYGGGAVGKASRNLANRRKANLSANVEENVEPEVTTETDTAEKAGTGIDLGSGLGLAGAAISALDTDPEYGNADVAGSALQFASMGAAAGPVGAAVGGAVGLGVGLLTKGKKKREKRREEAAKREKDQLSEDLKLQAERSEGYQNGGEIQQNNPDFLGHVDYKPSVGYGAGFIGPNETGSIYTRSGRPSESNTIIDDALESTKIKPETAYRLASRFIEPASMPDLSIQQDNTSLPKAPVTYKTGTKDDFLFDMQKYGNKFSDINKMTMGKYNTGGMTQGAYSHKTNPLAVVDKNGQHTGMELTGGEGVFDKPAMEKIKRMVAGGQFKEAGVFVNNEMKTWKHK